MPSTYTLNNGIELIATGEQSGTWGDTTNLNLGLVDTALDGQVTVTLPAAGTSGAPNALPISDGAASNGRNRLIIFADGGDLGATAFVQLTPNDAEKIVYIRNNLSGGRAITLFQGTYNAANDYEVPAGTTAVVFFNGGGSGAVAANVFNNAFFDSLRLGGVSVTAILDEDNMASDSATALATQQSIKAYVDAQVGANNELSEVLANGNTSGGTDIQMTTTDEVQFRDTALTIKSSVDGQLDIAADVELEIVAPTLDINASTAVTIDTTTLTMTGSVNVVGDLDVDNLNLNGNAIISTNTDGNIALTPNGTGEVDISKVDIDGGTIDGTVIGGSTPAAISGTTGSFSGNLTVDTDTLFVDAANNRVGLGTTGSVTSWTSGAAQRLQIAGSEAYPGLSAYTYRDTATTAPAGMVVLGRSGSATQGTLATTASGNSLGYVTFEGVNTSNTTVSGAYIRGRQNGSAGASFIPAAFDFLTSSGSAAPVIRQQIANNGDISFYEDTGTTPKFFWDASTERLGIGNAAPATSLDVTGTVTADGLTVDGVASLNADITQTSVSPSFYIMDSNTTDLNDRFVNAGGTIFLQTVNDAKSTFKSRFSANNSTGDISFYEDTGTTPKFFWDASAESLGLGTVSPDRKLTLSVSPSSATDDGVKVVEGSNNAVLARTGSAYSYKGVGASSTLLYSNNTLSFLADGSSNMTFHNGGNERMRIDSSGALLVGTTSAPNGTSVYGSGFVGETNSRMVLRLATSSTAQLSVARFYNPNGQVGEIKTEGTSTLYVTSSDYRLKEDVQPMVGASDRVQALNPVNFAWKAGGTRVDGFLAHEAQAIVPAAVTGEKDGEEMQAIDHSKLVPLLTAALQEALTEIADLKARVAALEA
jgi:hypothetical protein